MALKIETHLNAMNPEARQQSCDGGTSTTPPKWKFDAATFDRSAASFDNPDHSDRFDGHKLEVYPPGSVLVLPGNTSHCPLGLEYPAPGDDSRELGHDAAKRYIPETDTKG